MTAKVLALVLLAAPFALIALVWWGLQADHDRDGDA